MSPRRNWDSLTPSLASECAPPPRPGLLVPPWYQSNHVVTMTVKIIIVSSYTLIKKENQILLICKEIESGAVAKSYMRKGFLIYEEMLKYFPII
jgi:hypothetical protein